MSLAGVEGLRADGTSDGEGRAGVRGQNAGLAQPQEAAFPQLKGDGGFEVFEAEMHLASASPRGVMAQMEGDAYGVLTETGSLSAAIRVCVTESFVQGGDP